MPFVISITRNIRSIIDAPPKIVFIKEAWPGQSTRVNWIYLALQSGYLWDGNFVKNAENPRSRVIPLSLLWGFLSKLAVEVTLVNARTMDVFPLSIWPKTPKRRVN